MKINFEDGGYVEIAKTKDSVVIVVQAYDSTDNLKTITNACEISLSQFQALCQDIYEPKNTN